MCKLLKVSVLVKMYLWITAAFFLLSSTNFDPAKWDNILNVNKIYKNALCSEVPVFVAVGTHDIWHLDMACTRHFLFL